MSNEARAPVPKPKDFKVGKVWFEGNGAYVCCAACGWVSASKRPPGASLSRAKASLRECGYGDKPDGLWRCLKCRRKQGLDKRAVESEN